MSCLIGIALFMAAYQAFLIYSASFYREIFKIDRIFTSNIVVLAAFMFTAGSLGASRIMERLGKKKVIVSFGILGSILIALYTNIPDFWISLLVRTFCGFFMGVAFTGLNAMLLGQVPQFRGTVMSLESAIRNIGAMSKNMPFSVTLHSGTYNWSSCGKSAKEPFCVGSHKGTAREPVELIIEKTEQVALCACRRTNRPPYCDGTHTR